MRESVREQAALRTDEIWKFHMFEKISEAENFLEEVPLLDIISWDVTDEEVCTIPGENPQGLPTVLSDGSCGRQYFTYGLSASGNYAIVTSAETGQQRESGHGCK